MVQAKGQQLFLLAGAWNQVPSPCNAQVKHGALPLEGNQSQGTLGVALLGGSISHCWGSWHLKVGAGNS